MSVNFEDENKRYINLAIGITGHIDLYEEDKGILKNKIREVLHDLRKEFPNTPLILITALAEGADRLGAETALEEGIKYIVPLPLPYDEYVKDFPNTKDEFDNLLGSALGHFELPITKSELYEISHEQNARAKRYEKVGAFICKHSQILIALWDGNDISLTGGTSQVVKFKLEGVPIEYTPYRTILDVPDTGPVYHITTRRIKNKNQTADSNAVIKRLLPESKSQEEFFGKDGIFSKIDRFNQKVGILRISEIEASRKLLASTITEKEKFISFIYGETDSLASQLKKKWSTFQISLLAVTGVMLAVFLSYIYFNSLIILVSYLLVYIILVTLFRIGNFTHRYHEDYVEYRALAEGLRVEFFLRLAGVHEDSADQYLRKHRKHMQWVREIMRSANLFDPQQSADLGSIKKYWIEGQYQYYSHSAKKNTRKVRRLRIYSNLLLSMGIISIVSAVFLTVMNLFSDLHLITSLIISFPFLAGLIETYVSRSTMKETSEEYSRMAKIYDNANNLWKENQDEHNIQIVLELAKEALRENGDWLLLHYQIPEEMPL